MLAREGIGRHLSRRLLPLSVGIGLLLAVSPPLTYWLMEHHSIQHAANYYAEGLADDCRKLVLDTPGLWKYQAYKFMAISEGFHPSVDVSEFRILDEKGEQITRYEYKNERNRPGTDLTIADDLLVTRGSAPIRFNNRQVGTVEILVSDRRMLRTTAFIFCLSSLIGTTLAVLAFLFPVRVVKRAEEEILELNKGLELKVAERTKQLLDAQDELVRKEKLATLGQLAGSVGHELRNPLGVMNNAVYYLQTVLSGTDENVREYLDIMKSEISGAEQIVSDLLDSVRAKPPHPQLILVADLIRMSLEKSRIPERITVEVLPGTRQSVLIDPLQMTQVFINLITNAVDAMPEGGVLRVGARSIVDLGLTIVDLKSEINNHKSSIRGNFIEVSVTDTGCGISPENIKKLFQPLFTTKARGIGLGLVVVKNLTEANGGRVNVESEIGKGTVFRVTLPSEGA